MVGLTLAWFWTLRERLTVHSRTIRSVRPIWCLGDFSFGPDLFHQLQIGFQKIKRGRSERVAQRMSLKILFSISPLYSRTA